MEYALKFSYYSYFIFLIDPAIPVTEDDFFDHVTQMKLHNFKGFYEEFSSKKAEFQNSEAFRHPDNQSKNRYLNIPCFDDSRVKLEGGDDDVENYIHANYVPGAFNDKEYIYTQSPLPETVSDFWAMIWQQDCSNIVMVSLFEVFIDNFLFVSFLSL